MSSSNISDVMHAYVKHMLCGTEFQVIHEKWARDDEIRLSCLLRGRRNGYICCSRIFFSHETK